MGDLEKKVVDKKLNAIDIAKIIVGGLLVYDPIKKKILVESEEKKKLIRRTLGGAGAGALYDLLEKHGVFEYGKSLTDKVKDKLSSYTK